MEVHVVVVPESENGEAYTEGAFSSLRKARKYIKNQFDPKQPPRPYVDTLVVDKGLDLPAKTFATEFHVCLPCRDPLPKTQLIQSGRIEVIPANPTEYAKLVEIDYKRNGGLGAYANGYSIKSGEHAARLARRARRQWLKDHPDAKVRKVAQNIG